MNYLQKNKNVFFLGQSIKYSGNAIFNTLNKVAEKKKSNSLYLKKLKWGCR